MTFAKNLIEKLTDFADDVADNLQSTELFTHESKTNL